MSIPAMPFITGPVAEPQEQLRLSPPRGRLSAIIPLSKVQEVLWVDYLRQPWATHYNLTLKVDLTGSNLSLESIMNNIHKLGSRHDMLRTTFHIDSSAQHTSQSYMAVHDAASSFQNIAIVSDDARLQQALRRGLDLSTEFPVQWIVHQAYSVVDGRLVAAHTVYAMGHHIAVDGTSMSHLSRELVQLIQDGDTTTPPPPPPPSYGEFVQRQAAYLRSPEAQDAEAFWLAQIAHTTPHRWTHAAPLPASAPGHDYRKMDTWAFFPSDELAAWSQLYRTSWFRVAVSVIGLVTAGHARPAPHHDSTLQVAFGARAPSFAGCVSHMANTMPIRQPVSSLLRRSGSATFAELVQLVGKNISQAKKNEMYPFLSLVEAAARDGEDTAAASRVAVTLSPRLADDRCTLYPVNGVWDLFFCFLEHADGGVALGVISDPAVFGPAALAALRADVLRTVALSQQTPDFPLTSALSCLADRQVATLAGGPDVEDVDAVIAARVVSDWIRSRAATQPDEIALSNGEDGTSLTYGALDASSDRKAVHLQRLGAGRNDVVVLQLGAVFDMVAWILAVHKAGACFVVLDRQLPLARKQAILRVADAKLFVSDAFDDAYFADCATPPTTVSVWADTAVPADAHLAPVSGAAPTDLAYLVFTSGSTGLPKAIEVEHQNLSSYVSATRAVVPVGRGSRVLQFAPFAFDASVLEWAVTLSYGGTLCFVQHPALLVGDYLADMVDLNQINFFHTTPSVLATIPDGRRLPSLRALSVGGEASSAGLLDKWSRRLHLIHAYGPTETTVICATEHILPASDTLPSPSNIGRANPHVALLICPEDAETVLGPGVTGEICIAGPQVTRGYRGQPALTAAQFRTMEHNGRVTRMYRSGDRGFIGDDGKLHILGRMNNREIKLRGFRMDLAAIEKSILDNCPEVMTASVQVVDDKLVAFACPATLQGDAIRQRIALDLPSYSVPADITAVDSLPLNTNGKVDHKEVLQQFGASTGPAAAIKPVIVTKTAPKKKELQTSDSNLVDRLEASITTLWQKVLGCRDAPGPDVTFYNAGGHSILLSALHKELVTLYPAAKISLLDVFYNPTIRRQAQRLSELVGDDGFIPSSSVSDVSAQDVATPGNSTTATSVAADAPLFAIVGMAGRFPGADSVEAMWELLMAQRDGITTSDGAGAESADLAEGEVFVPRYGSINGLEDFRASDWNMSDEDAQVLDPQKRMFLMIAEEALQDASIPVRTVSGSNIGTFVGIAPNTYLSSALPSSVSSSAFERRYKAVLDPTASTLTAYKLNLLGPSMDVSAACASSLVAVHQALRALRAGDCAAALVGGVSLAYPQLGGYATSDGKIFSARGQCRPLDAAADGSVPADGVAAVVLKPLVAAQTDGDRVYAVIQGHAIGTDGAVDKIGFTVPSSSGQAKVISAAMADARLARHQGVRYVEMHGSGTSIGDALEYKGIERAVAAYEATGGESRCSSGAISPTGTEQQPSDTKQTPRTLFVGSNKGNFGNAEAASGLFSLIKASLAVSRGVVPPLRQLGDCNELMGVAEGSTVQPLRKQLRLEKGDRVGVTALGYGGVNAHCILASLEAVEERE
ncbi:non-ribosomal peptide synthetase [Cordyceps militaris CM01]|uniref:Hybrid PKS-NRPS synthetase TAS1 n=1 Tax=Cordyceps militaris (strain CM01) TaxID=983644 RepID=TAS1_CORMM|nr:non-ribosomal peptide synthetase [Cordyceps militaris CM01]EGX94166.1 non-ribosomal peptide synthetase [Cordyceps militaris CM01]